MDRFTDIQVLLAIIIIVLSQFLKIQANYAKHGNQNADLLGSSYYSLILSF